MSCCQNVYLDSDIEEQLYTEFSEHQDDSSNDFFQFDIHEDDFFYDSNDQDEEQPQNILDINEILPAVKLIYNDTPLEHLILMQKHFCINFL